jgi:hypothetical protein
LFALLERALLVAVLASDVKVREVEMSDEIENPDRRVESFLARVGFARLEGITGTDGVRGDWSILRADLSRQFSQLRPAFADVYLLGTGLVEADWVWNRGDNNLSVSIVVSGSGFAGIHRRLYSRSTETTMARIPYGSGPTDLGDLALRHRTDGGDLIMWVYRNVFVHVEGDSPGVELDLEPSARVIQRFMEDHHVARVAQHLPRVDRIETSAKQVHVGETWRIAVELGRGTPMDSVIVELDEDHDRKGLHRLEPLRSAGLRSSYQARATGTARVDIRIADRKTLLSPPLSASVEIVPVR